MPPATNDHSASNSNEENRFLKFNIPIIPGDNCGLTIYKTAIQ